MAQSLRCKLHALSSSRPPTPASVSNLFKSPDLRLSSRRWLASDALLEDQGIPVTETDGGLSAANDDESLVDVLKGIRNRQNDKVPASHNPSSEFLDTRLQSSLGRLTSLVSVKQPAPPSIPHGDGASKNQIQSDQSMAEQSRKSLDDTWRQMVSSFRSPSAKKKLKGVQGNISNKGCSLKTERSKTQLDFHDLDLSKSGGESSTDILVESISGLQSTVSQNTSSSKDFSFQKKGKPSHDSTSQNGNDIKVNDKQLDKDSSLEGTEGWSDLHNASKPDDSSCQMRTQVKNNDKLPSMTTGQEYSLTRTSEDRSLQDTDHLVIKDSANYKRFSQTSMALDSRFKQDVSLQASDKNNSVSRQSYMVCVQNLPPSSNPSTVKASMAVHGEVVGFFKKSIHDRLNVYIQFKTAVAMENALASRTLQVGCKKCYISRTDNSAFTTVVRISKVAIDTDEREIRTVCEQYGKVDDVKKRVHMVFDVFYDVKELSNIPNILGSLSEVTLNRSTWLALPAPLLHPSVQKELVKSPEGQSWLDTQINQTIYKVEAGLDGLNVLFQDLKEVNSVAREFSK